MDSLPINPVDLAVLTVLLLSAILAFARGFVREVLSVAAWIGAAAVAFLALPYARPLAADLVGPEMVATAVAAVAVFLLALLVLSFLAGRIARAVRGSSLSALDRSLGFLFGLARGAVFVCLSYLLVTWVYPNPAEHPDLLRKARTMPVIQSGADQIRLLLPKSDDGAAAEAARREREAEARLEALRRISTPVPPATVSGATQPESGYNDGQRMQLDRLIEINGLDD